ncbi:MAG: hypothetical protein BWY71_01665 [Planctomycetes bacterium ADurb.Bin412]|nr:MAG: hypothetical protein BWY71_01665 [Planctomycetes bacterium ADurb.Bin412]
MNAFADDFGAIVEGFDLNAVGQYGGGIDFRHFGLDPFDDRAAVFSFKKHHHPAYRFAFAVLQGQALPQGVRGFHLGDIPDIDGYAVLGFQNDIADVGHILEEADAADDILLGWGFDDVAAGVLVIPFDGLEHLLDGKPVGQKFFRM